MAEGTCANGCCPAGMCKCGGKVPTTTPATADKTSMPLLPQVDMPKGTDPQPFSIKGPAGK